jgi:hypothetical protein
MQISPFDEIQLGLIDAGVKWQSGCVHGSRDMVTSASQKRPRWLHWFYTFSHNVFAPDPHVWAHTVAPYFAEAQMARCTVGASDRRT